MDNKTAEKLEIEISNQDHLIQVCGIEDSNLKFLEQRLNVQIFPKGNTITLLGSQKDTHIAYNILYSLYELCTTGLPIENDHLKMAFKIEKNKYNEESAEKQNEKKDFSVNSVNKKKSMDNLIITPKRRVAPKSENQKTYIKKLKENTISFSVGPAGTGKTYLATALAVEKLMNKEVAKIVLTRPVVEAGESLGFLPGALEEKIDPYLRPFFDAINQMLGAEKVQQLLDQSIIEIAPLAYMRGRTISNSFMLLDEAQNTTKMQMKMFLTRLGENSQAVITGDPTQIDLPKRDESGLLDAVKRLRGIKEIAVVEFNSTDVIRHELVSKIIQAYDNNSNNKGK